MSPTNSEAEPAEEGVRENGGEGVEQVEANQQQEEVSPPASVQSSEEARVEGNKGGRGGNNESGAADSSDQVQVAASVGEVGDKEEDTSPDQSGTS